MTEYSCKKKKNEVLTTRMGFISDWAVKRKKLALEILIMAADDLEKVWEDKNRQKRLQSEKEIEIGDREY